MPSASPWSQQRDSNPRPFDYKSSALPTELYWRVCTANVGAESIRNSTPIKHDICFSKMRNMSSPNPQVIPLPGSAQERTVRFPSQRTGHSASPGLGDDATQDLEITNILLLDDDVELADTLKLLLESRNFIVTTAHNGVGGLREIMAMDFDVIICDMMMPTMPGDMFYLAVQKVKPHLCARFLFVTGNGDDPRTNDFLHHADGLVVFKPVPGDELLQMISLVLQRNARSHV